MAVFNKFEPFVEHLAEGVHNFSSDATCTITVALSATAPTASWATLSQVTQVSYTNLSTRVVTTTSSSQTSGTYSLVASDLVLTASGAVATFRYIILYNDDPTSPADPLIGYYDYGQDVTLANGETFTIDFSGTGIFTLA